MDAPTWMRGGARAVRKLNAARRAAQSGTFRGGLELATAFSAGAGEDVCAPAAPRSAGGEAGAGTAGTCAPVVEAAAAPAPPPPTAPAKVGFHAPPATVQPRQRGRLFCWCRRPSRPRAPNTSWVSGVGGAGRNTMPGRRFWICQERRAVARRRRAVWFVWATTVKTTEQTTGYPKKAA